MNGNASRNDADKPALTTKKSPRVDRQRGKSGHRAFLCKYGTACFRAQAPAIGDDFFVVVTPSAKVPDTWQATLFEGENPIKDKLFRWDGYEELLIYIQRDFGVNLDLGGYEILTY